MHISLLSSALLLLLSATTAAATGFAYTCAGVGLAGNNKLEATCLEGANGVTNYDSLDLNRCVGNYHGRLVVRLFHSFYAVHFLPF